MHLRYAFEQSEVTPWHICTAFGVILFLRVFWTGLYRVFLHPLARYPGPLITKLSDIPMTIWTAKAQSTYMRHAIHKKYGSAVRTGPNELCFSDIASIKDIYGQSTEPCVKAPFFYNGFTLTGMHSVFSETNRASHSRTRRLLSHGFSQQGVMQSQPQIIELIERFLEVISSSSKPFNIHDYIHNLFLDTTSQLSLGNSFNLLSGHEHQGARDIETYFSISPLFGVFPIAKYLPFGIFRAARQARPRILASVQNCINDFRHRLQGGTAQHGLLRLMVEAKDGDTGTAFSDEELIENAVLFIIAGSGTTATTLIYLLYEVGKRPEMQTHLEHEIREAFPDVSLFPSFDTATNLPYLNGVLQEVLRLRGPIPTVAPRISPGKVIGGQYVPAGVVVSNLAYTTHRDPAVFPDPEEFLPERWKCPSQEMKSMYRPFSTGPRNCIGMHLARVQLLLVVCAIYQRFEVKLHPRTTAEMMVMRDQGVMTPTGKQLWVSVTRRK